MRAIVWGCRGSLAAPGPETVAYGGNTSCVQLELTDGTPLVLDAGTGIRLLGLELARRPRRPIHVVLTHLHLDHLEGLGFFVPLWEPGLELHIWGPASPVDSLEERITKYLSPPLFPVQLAEVPSNVTFHDLPDEPFTIGSARILAEPVSHRGPTVGLRIEEPGGRTLTYIPDHEPYLGAGPAGVDPEWLSGFSLADGTHVLMHDAQYFEHEYPNHVGWGHSSVEHAVTFAQASGVERLVLFHHDPMHSDDQLRSLQARARALWGPNGHAPELAHEGMTLSFVAEVEASSQSASR
jgi:phosphoribosyl 1,2-cyclic phosphodiesterase